MSDPPTLKTPEPQTITFVIHKNERHTRSLAVPIKGHDTVHDVAEVALKDSGEIPDAHRWDMADLDGRRWTIRAYYSPYVYSGRTIVLTPRS